MKSLEFTIGTIFLSHFNPVEINVFRRQGEPEKLLLNTTDMYVLSLKLIKLFKALNFGYNLYVCQSLYIS